MIYLDTHVILWLYTQKGGGLSELAIQMIEESATILISPMVLLELHFLHEINRIRIEPTPIYNYLHQIIGLTACTKPFFNVIQMAYKQSWTRDPFDRIITAQAALDGSPLITKDSTILQNYSYAKW